MSTFLAKMLCDCGYLGGRKARHNPTVSGICRSCNQELETPAHLWSCPSTPFTDELTLSAFVGDAVDLPIARSWMNALRAVEVFA